MADKKQSATPEPQEQNPQNAGGQQQTGFTCSGDCMGCSICQRQYCASQNAYYAMRVAQQAALSIEEIKVAINKLTVMVGAIEETKRNEGTAQRIVPQDS